MNAASHADPMRGCATAGPRRRDWLLAFGAVLVLADVFDALLIAAFGENAVLMPGLPVSRALLLLVFLAAALLLAADVRGAAERVRAGWPLWPAVALAFASAIWSDQRGTTTLWAAALLGVSVFGVALALRFSPRVQVDLTAAAVASAALGSVLVTLVWPAFAFSGHKWQGLFVHRNLLGKVLALGTAAAFVATMCGRRRAAGFFALLVCGGALVVSQSRASLLSAMIAVAAAALLLAARRWRRHASAILTGGTVVTLLGVLSLIATPPGLALLARSPSFSDRTRIWRAVAAGADEAPWLGHGYAAFWPGPAGQEALARIDIPLGRGQAHNGFIDLYAELGLAGLVLVCVPLVFLGIAALRHALAPGASACIWPATLIVFFVASNGAESGLLRHKVYWALYVAAACHVARSHRSHASHTSHGTHATYGTYATISTRRGAGGRR